MKMCPIKEWVARDGTFTGGPLTQLYTVYYTERFYWASYTTIQRDPKLLLFRGLVLLDTQRPVLHCTGMLERKSGRHLCTSVLPVLQCSSVYQCVTGNFVPAVFCLCYSVTVYISVLQAPLYQCVGKKRCSICSICSQPSTPATSQSSTREPQDLKAVWVR